MPSFASAQPHPAISVLMPAFNAGPFIGEAIDSVLAQTAGDLELLIIDDGSTDNTWDVVSRYRDHRIRAWQQRNTGKSAALNTLLRHAAGDVVVLQDADDVSMPNRLAALSQAFQRSPGTAALLSGHALRVGNRVIAPRAEAKPPGRCRAETAALRMPAHDPTLACRTEIARSLGFDPGLRFMEGVDFVFRLAEQHDIAVLGDCLYQYRLHRSSLTHGDPVGRGEAMRTVLERTRARRGLPPLTTRAFDKGFGRACRDPANNLIGHFTDSVYLLRSSGHTVAAVGTAIDALGTAPLRPASLKPLAYALMPTGMARSIRRRGLDKRLSA